MPADATEKAILFHVPYRQLSNGHFRTIWLIRSAANRLMHARGSLEELFLWLTGVFPQPGVQRLRKHVHDSFMKWKTLNVLCARYELGAGRTIPALLFQQLKIVLEADYNLGLACQMETAGSLF